MGFDKEIDVQCLSGLEKNYLAAGDAKVGRSLEPGKWRLPKKKKLPNSLGICLLSRKMKIRVPDSVIFFFNFLFDLF